MYKSFLISALAVTLLTGALVEAAPGDLDTTFGSAGTVTTSIDLQHDDPNAIAVLPNGKILVAGRTRRYDTGVIADLDIALLRYNTDGTLDTTFDGDGIVTTDLLGDETANAITVLADGSILLGGRGSGAYVVLKYTASGVLDTAFAGGNGYLVVDPDGAGNANCLGMAITATGNILLAGTADLGTHSEFALVQVTTDGTVDTTFGVNGNGIVLTNPGSITSNGRAIAVQPDGKILLAGDEHDGTSTNIALLRFNANGVLDTTFDTDGIVITDNVGFTEIGRALAIQPNGNILVAGESFVSGSGYDFAVVRYLPDGSLDTGFGTNGITTTPVVPGADKARAVVIQPDGKVIVAGFADNNSHDDFAITRYTTNGLLDTGFGSAGIMTTVIGGRSLEVETGYALALQTNGKVLLVESNDATGNREFVMARYLAIDADNNANTAEPWDVTPAAFSFTDNTESTTSSLQTSSNITVSGLGTGVYVPVTVAGGEVAINGGSYTSDMGYVTNGSEMSVRHTSSSSISTQTHTVLTIGGLHAPNNTSFILGTTTTDTFSSTTDDLTPNSFSLTDKTGVTTSSTITSDTITVSGVAAATVISVSGGSYYSINGGTCTNTSGTVVNGNTIAVCHTSSASPSTPVITTLTIGGVSGAFTSITADDVTPAEFSFIDQTGVATSATITSASITVAGVSSATAISVSGGSYYSINGGTCNNTSGTVVDGNTIAVCHTSSGTASTSVTTTLTIGDVSNTFTSTTADDLTPNTFSFTDVTNVAHNTQMTSNSFNVSGITAATAISVSGGSYSINGGSYTSSAGTVISGNTVTVRHTSSAADTTAINTTLTMGGISDTYTSTTSDLTPAAFSFTDATHVAQGATMTSNSISVSGITAATPISVSGGSYAINDGTYTSSPGTVISGDSVTVRHTSAVTASTATSTTLTIGDVSDTFTSITADDVIPDVFSFTEVTAVATSSTQSSNSITVAGITAATEITVSGGTYSVNGGLYTSTSGVVVNGDTITVQHTSAATASTTTHTTLTIGGISGVFTSTTASAGGTGSSGGGGALNTWWFFLFLLPLWISRNKSRLQ